MREQFKIVVDPLRRDEDRVKASINFRWPISDMFKLFGLPTGVVMDEAELLEIERSQVSRGIYNTKYQDARLAIIREKGRQGFFTRYKATGRIPMGIIGKNINKMSLREIEEGVEDGLISTDSLRALISRIHNHPDLKALDEVAMRNLTALEVLLEKHDGKTPKNHSPALSSKLVA